MCGGGHFLYFADVEDKLCTAHYWVSGVADEFDEYLCTGTVTIATYACDYVNGANFARPTLSNGANFLAKTMS